jgi:hypothetical protein
LTSVKRAHKIFLFLRRSELRGATASLKKIKNCDLGKPSEGLPAGGVMRVDCGYYVRDFALAATLFGALVNSASYAQRLKALANMKNPKFVLDLSWPKTLLALLATLFIYGRKQSGSVTASTRI